MPLSDVHIRKLKPAEKPYRQSDGGNLCIEVRPNGSKLWKLFYRIDGRMKTLSLGPYPAVSLAQARAHRLEAKSLLKRGADPIVQARSEREAQRALAKDTFAAVAAEMLAKAEREGRAENTMIKKRWLIGMANADLGSRPITAITAAEILKTLKREEAKGNFESTRRLRATIGQ